MDINRDTIFKVSTELCFKQGVVDLASWVYDSKFLRSQKYIIEYLQLTLKISRSTDEDTYASKKEKKEVEKCDPSK